MVQTTGAQPSDTLRGVALLDDPIRNKGTAFTSEERRRYGLEGLLPHAVENLDRQVERVMEHLEAKPNDLQPYSHNSAGTRLESALAARWRGAGRPIPQDP